MAIHKQMIAGVIKEIRRLVGSELSTMPSPANGLRLASVIKDRAKGVRPSYPFITVDLDMSQATTPWLKDAYYDTVDNKQVYVNEQRIPFVIRCFGDGSVDILNSLRIKLDYDIDRHSLNNNTGAVFQYFSDIDDTPSFLATDFVEAASINMYFSAETIWSPDYDDAKNIAQVRADGEILSTEDDMNPIDTPVIEPKNISQSS